MGKIFLPSPAQSLLKIKCDTALHHNESMSPVKIDLKSWKERCFYPELENLQFLAFNQKIDIEYIKFFVK